MNEISTLQAIFFPSLSMKHMTIQLQLIVSIKTLLGILLNVFLSEIKTTYLGQAEMGIFFRSWQYECGELKAWFCHLVWWRWAKILNKFICNYFSLGASSAVGSLLCSVKPRMVMLHINTKIRNNNNGVRMLQPQCHMLLKSLQNHHVSTHSKLHSIHIFPNTL